MKKILYRGKWMYTGNKNNDIITDFQMMTEGENILWVKGAAEKVREEYEECIDLGESYVLPGFIDSHVHLLCSDSGADMEYSHPGRRAANIICQGAQHAKQLAKAGIVACRDLGSCEGYVLGIRDSIDRGELTGPKIIACGKAVCATGGHGTEISYECDGKDEVVKTVRQVVKDGADVVKMMVTGGVNSPGPEPGPSEFTKEEIQAGIDAAHALGRKTAVHAHGNTAIRNCVEAGVDSVEHGVFMTEDIMEMMQRQGTFLVPTLCAPYYAVKEGLRQEPDNPDHKKSQQVLKRHREVLKLCARKGVPIAFGTDAGCPFNPYEKSPYEMVLMVEAGLTPEKAIEAATMGSAVLLGIEEEYGSLESGKKASFVCCKGDPLERIEYVAEEKDVYLNNKKISSR